MEQRQTAGDRLLVVSRRTVHSRPASSGCRKGRGSAGARPTAATAVRQPARPEEGDSAMPKDSRGRQGGDGGRGKRRLPAKISIAGERGQPGGGRSAKAGDRAYPAVAAGLRGPGSAAAASGLLSSPATDSLRWSAWCARVTATACSSFSASAGPCPRVSIGDCGSGSRARLAAVAGAGRGWPRPGHPRSAGHLERDGERRLEDADSRPRLVDHP